MELHELNKGDDIWFKYPKAKTSFPAVVEELNYNFNGEPYLMVRVGSELVKIDDRYDIVKVQMKMTIISNKKVDMVNKPKHYTYGDIEVIDFIEQVTKDYKPELAFSIGNAIKYISRANHKNGREDLDKARWYLNRAFEKWEDA